MDSEDGLPASGVFVTAKTYAGLLSGCIAVDKAKFSENLSKRKSSSTAGHDSRVLYYGNARYIKSISQKKSFLGGDSSGNPT